MLEAETPGLDLARAYAYRAEEEMLAGHVNGSMSLADRALVVRDHRSDGLRLAGGMGVPVSNSGEALGLDR